jgi:CHAT domain-containing protein/predicted negative regulator of RcsB-dependent stress response
MDEGRRLRTAGKLSEAISAYQRAAGEAKRSGNREQEAAALIAVGGCQIRQHLYSAGFKTSTRAKELALQAGDFTTAGRADVSISSIYSLLGDFEGAKATAEEAAKYLENSPRRDYYAMSLTARGEIEFGLGQYKAAENSLRRALSVAKEAHDDTSAADIADRFGIWLVLRGDLKQAESLLMESFQIRRDRKDDDGLAISYEHLAELESKKGKAFLRLALQYIDKAFATSSLTFKTGPSYYPIHTRGRILRDLGQDGDALAAFRQAVEAADFWRQSALPGDATNTKTVQMLNETYHDFADFAAEQSIKRGDQALAREALEVLARNRAASLREQLTRAYSQRLVESPEYFPLLSKLQELQARVTLGADPKAQQSLVQMRSQLNDIENRIGIESQNLYRFTEKTLHRNSLRDIQTRLGEDEALLSFSLGERRSFLWAITKDDLKLYELPDEGTINSHIPARAAGANSAFRMAENDTVLDWFARTLFGKLDSAIWYKHHWLITPDGQLLDSVPFPALRIASQQGGRHRLISDRSLRFLPSELLLLTPKPSRPAARFVGVGDPIYNFADTRSNRAAASKHRALRTNVLGRLVASDKEVTDSAQASGQPKTELLKGIDASGVQVRKAIATTPEILHFAVHVVSPEGEPAEAALALSIDADGVPELLTAESVATYRVPGSLVVLSGCSTQQGRIIPGAGLVGLSRAWLLAGASAVVVSSWPTPDGSLQFFSNFYTHYKQAAGSIAQRAAVALQRTQLDMQHDMHATKKDPTFWAAYSIVSKE